MENHQSTLTFMLKYSGEHLENPTPFFHKGPQGMAPKIDHLADVHKLATVSEL